MTLFEYLAIAFSLVFSFSGMRLVGGLLHAVQQQRRYWIHLCFVFWQLMATVFGFWAFWSFRSVEWNFPTFVLVLVSPGLIYYNACALVPENPEAVESWRDYYYSVRKRYFAGVSCWALAALTISAVIGMPLADPARGVQAVFLAAALVGVSSANERVQAGIALCLLLLTLLVMFSLGFRPGSFAPP